MATAARKKADRTTVVATVVDTAPMEFRKANEAIGLRVVEGKMTLLIKKVFNVLMYHAQIQKVLGTNAPIDTSSAQNYFWVPLSELASDAAFGSKDMEYLKEQLNAMQNIKLLLETDRQWTSERLISSITFVNPKGLKSRTGQVWFGFAFPPEVFANVMAPGTYTKLSIMYQSSLRSGSALSLYEICRRFATNPSKMTYIQTYHHWYGSLTGTAIDEADLPEYKYFKRDVLKPAIAEVNKLTDIEVELVEHKKSRRVDSLQFRVLRAKQPQLDFHSKIIDLELVGAMMKLGFKQEEASESVAEYGLDRSWALTRMTQGRIASDKMEPLKSPVAYWKYAAKKNIDAVATEPAIAGPGKAAPAAKMGASAMEKFLAFRSNEALELYGDYADDEKRETYSEFKASQKSKVPPFDKFLDQGVTRTLFKTWLAERIWGTPEASDIAAWMDKIAGVPV